MTTSIKNPWEIVIEHNGTNERREKIYEKISRTKVYGGWIVKCYSSRTGGNDIPQSQEYAVFVPDKENEWKLPNNID